jgi:hypothetical protein
MEHLVIFKCILRKILHLISPTHKRTEGRAPVWGSELTSKDAALQGGFGKLLNAKLCDLPGGDKNIREKKYFALIAIMMLYYL